MDVSVAEKKGPAALEKFGFQKKEGPGPVPGFSPVVEGTETKKPSPLKGKGKETGVKKTSPMKAKAKGGGEGKGTLEAFGFGK